MTSQEWRKCSTCKTSLSFGGLYYVCSVSTCNRKRTGLFFCSVECWEVHLPMARHREAWAVEESAPSREAWLASGGGAPASPGPGRSGASPAPVRRRVVDSGGGAATDVPREVLIVVSRFKAYVKDRHGMNTSDGLFEALSEELRRLADEASDHARLDGRKTLLDRDFRFVRANRST